MDNPFFREVTAGWPFPRLVDLTADTELVIKPARAVLYEEGEAASQHDDSISSKGAILCGVLGGGVASCGVTAGGPMVEQGIESRAAGVSGAGELGCLSGTTCHGFYNPGITGAYVVLRGAVDLYALER